MRARFSISTFKAKKSSLWFQLFSIYLDFKVGSTTTSYCLVHSSETNQETKRKCKLFVSEQEKKERKVQHNLNSKRRLPHIFEPGKSFYSSAQIVHNVFFCPESNWSNVNVTFYFLLTKKNEKDTYSKSSLFVLRMYPRYDERTTRKKSANADQNDNETVNARGPWTLTSFFLPIFQSFSWFFFLSFIF